MPDEPDCTVLKSRLILLTMFSSCKSAAQKLTTTIGKSPKPFFKLLMTRGGDQTLATPRPSYPINSTSPGTDAWASTAAAFAMGAFLYSTNTTYNSTSSSSPPTSPSLANDTYSSMLLSHAETLYKTAVNVTPYTGFGYSIPDIASAYNGSNYGAPLAEAALALALATNESSYYSDAYSHYQKYNLTGTTRPWTWDSRAPSLYVLFVETAIARPGLAEGAGLDANLTGWQAEAERYFDNIVNLNTSAVFLTKGKSLPRTNHTC